MARFRLSLERAILGICLFTIACFDVNLSIVLSHFHHCESETHLDPPGTVSIEHAPLFLVVGLPKSGTTSMYHLFSCSRYSTSHYCCCGSNRTEYPCGGLRGERMLSRRLEENIQAERPMFSEAGNYQVYTQLDGERMGDEGYILPQHYQLPQLHEAAPRATWILTLRPPDDWARSVLSWLDMAQRLQVEYGRHTKQAHPHDNPHRFLVDFYQQHVDRIRRFVELHPSHQLIEVDITSPAIGSILAKAIPGVSGKCWSRHNAGPFFEIVN
jgi:hypothetical protein